MTIAETTECLTKNRSYLKKSPEFLANKFNLKTKTIKRVLLNLATVKKEYINTLKNKMNGQDN